MKREKHLLSWPPMALGGWLAVVGLVVASTLAGGRPVLAVANTYEYYVEGNPEDVTTPTSPGLLLMGGSTDVDAAIQWMIERSGGGDFVVIRASGTDAYNPYIYYDLGGVDSAATIITKKAEAAYDPFVIDTIRNAEALFIAGGNQWDYVRLWKGTPIEEAIEYVAGKGAPIGGTSAGLAILGEFVFSARHGTIVSKNALKNPYQPRVALDRDFLDLPHLGDVITDSHFAARNRMGRLVTFLARIVQDGWAEEAHGIGVDERTALVVDGDGMATLMGQGSVYFLNTPGPPQVCEKATPLTFLDVGVYRISDAMASFDLVMWSGQGGTAYTLSAVEGVLTSTQEGGGIY
jgi:cyanophycinase